MAQAATAATMLGRVGLRLTAAKTNATRTISHASASTATAVRTGVPLRKARENTDMAAVSQGLVDFANHHRQPPGPGFEVITTPRYVVTLQPDFPIPGPNSVTYVRCRPGEADEVIREARAIVAPHRLAFMWILDPETEPPNLADFLDAHDVHPDGHGPAVKVMVLPVTASIEGPDVPGLEMRDALVDDPSFDQADAVNREAFKSDLPADPAANARRRRNQVAAGNRRLILATIDGEPAGSAGITLFPPAGAIINGGAVRPKFRGRGIYRAMVAARLAMAREAGVPGLAVWGGAMSAPILAKLGFQSVGWRKFYLDLSAV
jgi:GNAT superfamily N-acetyltransferase